MCAIERPDGFRWHVVLGVCLALREAALGSAGFNQQHHLLFLRVIGAQWAPSARLPSTSATPTPLLTAWCPMYLHCLSCTHNWYSMCSPQLCLFKLEKHLVLTHIGTMDVESWLLLNLLMQILYLEPKWVNSINKYNIDIHYQSPDGWTDLVIPGGLPVVHRWKCQAILGQIILADKWLVKKPKLPKRSLFGLSACNYISYNPILNKQTMCTQLNFFSFNQQFEW